MDEPYRSPADEPGAGDRTHPAGRHETRPFGTYPQPRPGAPYPQPRPGDAYPEPRPGDPYRQLWPEQAYEPLAHEGGLPYGVPPAPVYNPAPGQYVPQHLAMPSQFAPHHYGPPGYPHPYMYPPQQMQQTVFVNNNGGRRVNHVLHLLLTIFTAGLWLPIWIILVIANS